MADFRTLVSLLQQELETQEKLLEVLSQERAAIVKLNRDQILELEKQKQKILSSAQTIGSRRSQVIGLLTKGAASPKLDELVKLCSDRETKAKLDAVGKELKSTCKSVQEMNNHNSELIKQSLGLVVSTIAIFRSAPGTDLPSYNEAGTLRTSDDPAFTPRGTTIIREA